MNYKATIKIGNEITEERIFGEKESNDAEWFLRDYASKLTEVHSFVINMFQEINKYNCFHFMREDGKLIKGEIIKF